MTTMIGPTAPAVPAYRDDQRVTQARVIRSEWTKLRSLPSSAWSLLVAVVLMVGFGALYCGVRVARPPHDPAAIASFDPTSISLAGVQLAQIAIGILGVLLFTGEYATGMIRTSFAAVPTRLPVLWGKAVGFALALLALCVPATFAAFLVGQSILSSGQLDTTLRQPGTARAVLGAALYLAAVGLFGLGLGALLRSTAAAVGALFGLLFAPQILVGFLPSSWSDHLYGYLPAPAGIAVTSARPDPTALAPWTGFSVFCLYTAVLLALAAWRLRGSDA
jgi:ABC-2 type transport system permease protein